MCDQVNAMKEKSINCTPYTYYRDHSLSTLSFLLDQKL